MICVQCKNEKWEEAICPVCGLGEKEALLTRADQFRGEGSHALAAEYYGKYLEHDSGNIDVLTRKANALYLEAVSRREKVFFDKAEESLAAVLQKDWNWETGHQLRVDLYFCFGMLDELAREYEKILNEDGPRKNKALDILKVIQLTKKFKESPPDVFTEMNNSGEWTLMLKGFWPLLTGVPLLLWVAYEFASAPRAREDNNVPVLFFVLMIIALTIVLLIYVSMKMYKGNRKKRKEGNGIA